MIVLYNEEFIIVSIYVDDLLIAVMSLKLVKKAKAVLSKKFDMKDLKEAQMIIEMQIIHH